MGTNVNDTSGLNGLDPGYTLQWESMKLYVGVTDDDWFRFLSARPALDEVNFWPAKRIAEVSRFEPR